MLHHPSALQVTDETADNGRFYNDDDFEVLNLDENFDECMYIDYDGGTDEFCCFFFDFACPPDCGDEDVPTEEECYGIEDDGGVHAGCCCAYSHACEFPDDDGSDSGDDEGCPEDPGELVCLFADANGVYDEACCCIYGLACGGGEGSSCDSEAPDSAFCSEANNDGIYDAACCCHYGTACSYEGGYHDNVRFPWHPLDQCCCILS